MVRQCKKRQIERLTIWILGYWLLILVLCIPISVNSEKADDADMRQVLSPSMPLNGESVFLCDYDHQNHIIWCALRVRQAWNIPIISPQYQTWVYSIHLDSGQITLEFRISANIYEMCADKSGLYFTKDHLFFLDETICYYNSSTHFITQIQTRETVGKMIAVNNESIVFRGSHAYDDDSIYILDRLSGSSNIIESNASQWYIDETSIYVMNTGTKRVTEYNICSRTANTFTVPNDGIRAIAYGMVITDNLEIYQLTQPSNKRDWLEQEETSSSIHLKNGRIYVINNKLINVYDITTGQLMHTYQWMPTAFSVLCKDHLVILEPDTFSIVFIDIYTEKRRTFQLPTS